MKFSKQAYLWTYKMTAAIATVCWKRQQWWFGSHMGPGYAATQVLIGKQACKLCTRGGAAHLKRRWGEGGWGRAVQEGEGTLCSLRKSRRVGGYTGDSLLTLHSLPSFLSSTVSISIIKKKWGAENERPQQGWPRFCAPSPFKHTLPGSSERTTAVTNANGVFITIHPTFLTVAF